MFSRALVRCVAKFPQPFNFQSQIDLANCFFFVVCLFIVKTRKVSSWSDVRHEALEHEINAIVCSLFFFFIFRRYKLSGETLIQCPSQVKTFQLFFFN